jgi:hypothetical protein
MWSTVVFLAVKETETLFVAAIEQSRQVASGDKKFIITTVEKYRRLFTRSNT